MEKAVKHWYAMSDPAILEVLGNFIQQTRLQQNKTQQQVVVVAGKKLRSFVKKTTRMEDVHTGSN